SCNCTVEIKLEKWQIPQLLGAIRLAHIAEGWCARLREASDEGMDIYDDDFELNWFLAGGNDSLRWRKHIEQIIGQIKKQTGLDLEYMESADRDDIRALIENFVEKEKIRKLEEYRKAMQGIEINRSWLWKNKVPGDPEDYEIWAQHYAIRSMEKNE
ncbi:hypothetical protein ACFLQQ_04005, partial [Actinomycetota bacterium]